MSQNQLIKNINIEERDWPSSDIPVVRGIDISSMLSFKTKHANVYYSADKSIYISIHAEGGRIPEKYSIHADTLDMNDYGEDFKIFAHTHARMAATDLKKIILDNLTDSPAASAA